MRKIKQYLIILGLFVPTILIADEGIPQGCYAMTKADYVSMYEKATGTKMHFRTYLRASSMVVELNDNTYRLHQRQGCGEKITRGKTIKKGKSRVYLYQSSNMDDVNPKYLTIRKNGDLLFLRNKNVVLKNQGDSCGELLKLDTEQCINETIKRYPDIDENSKKLLRELSKK